MTERDQLLAAIHADPHDDTPRLVYADWLEEHGDDFDQKHAELIRVQCEFERHLRLDDAEYAAHLRTVERLLAAVEPVVRRGAKCGRCKGEGYLVSRGIGGQSNSSINPVCTPCQGVGYTGTLAMLRVPNPGPNPPPKDNWHNRCDWSRGFPYRVYCTLDEYQREVGRIRCVCRNHNGGTSTRMGPCQGCDGKGYRSVTFAEQLLREHGTVVEVVLTGKNPGGHFSWWGRPSDRNSSWWGRPSDRNSSQPDFVPWAIFQLLRGGEAFAPSEKNQERNPPEEWLYDRVYNMHADALTALSRAAADHARQLAGLPRAWAGSHAPG